MTAGFGRSLLVIAIVASFQSLGCSAIGFTIGSLSDGSRNEVDTLNVTHVWQIHPNQDVGVLKTDGRLISGEFSAVDTVPYAEYRSAYDAARGKPEGSGLPAIGDTVSITFGTDLRRSSLQGTFVGFDPGIMHLRLKESLVTIPVETINALNSHQVTIQTVRSCMSSGCVPFMSQLLLKDGTEVRGIGLNGVREVYLNNSLYARWIGLGVGVTLDLLIIHFIHQSERPYSTDFW